MIELWWWVRPLFLTGLFAMLVAAAIVVVLEKTTDGWLAEAVVAGVATLPWAVCALSVVYWLVGNLMILVWSR